MNQEVVAEVKNFLISQHLGVLSTHSLSVDGYPFGSLTPFVVDELNRPIILISSLAEHTKNIKANSKVSLTIIENTDKANKQALARLSIMADARPISGPDVSKTYLKHFPEARNYFDTHDFSFYALEPVRLRYIAGFGKIYWIEPKDLES